MPYLVCDACGLTTQDRDMSTDGSCPRCGADPRRIVARFERSTVTAVRPMIDVSRRAHAVRRARFRRAGEQ
jgi:predicted RNA-binding Zn-ribbon protein involved in translation (DUF1610 family)